MDGLCKLGFLAAEYLLAGNAGYRTDESTAIVLCNSSGSLNSDLAHLQNAGQPSPAVFVYTLPNIVAGEIAIRHGIKGETAFFISERIDDSIARQYAAGLLESGMASSCIAGWVDCTEEQYLARMYFLAPNAG
jgi:3-oxoacyl-(acyl-carrier-protein) synthase